MKAVEFSQSALDDLRMRIRWDEGQQAFDRLVKAGFDSPSLHSAPGARGQVRDFRYTSVDPRGWPFAFTVGKSHLLFCIRPLGIRTLGLSKSLLAAPLEVLHQRAGGELQIAVCTRLEAEAIVEQILSRWPADRMPTGEKSVQTEARATSDGFRANVEQVESICRATGVMDRRHLRAIPIKPWDKCRDGERLDGNNGLMLSPHVAHLFERGYIAFADDGHMLVSRQLNSTVLKRWGLAQDIPARPFTAQQTPYLAWHREHVFEKAEAGRRRRD
jgi:hypothetical protein